MFKIIAALLALLVLACQPAAARSLSDQEGAALSATVAAFDNAMRTADYDKVIDLSIPPRMFAMLAKKANAPADKLRAFVIQQTRGLMQKAQLESFGMELAKATHRELKNGQPYSLIPTRTVIDGGSRGRIVQTSHTLAHLDGGKWYLLRISDLKQVSMLQETYPEFSGVELPRGTMEIEKK